MDTYATLNDALVKLFRDVMDLEEQAIITQEFQDITNNDVHVIQAIGTGEPKNMSMDCQRAVCDGGNPDHSHEQSGKEGLRDPGTRKRRPACSLYFAVRKRKACL